MSKLLNKPFKAFTLYALIILIASIPVYYWAVDFIWLQELEEHNDIIKQNIKKQFEQTQIEENKLKDLLEIWNQLQPNAQLTAVKGSEVRADFVYTTIKKNEYDKEDGMDRFHGLTSYIFINGKPYQLLVETNVEEADETLFVIAVITFLFFCLLVGGFIILNRRIAHKIWKPFDDTLNQLKAYELSTQKNIQFQESNIEEFEELHGVLNKLIERNINTFKQQKTFIENASHELQTPLAVLTSKLDMLLQHEDLNENQSNLIASIRLPLSRISRINKNILLLAKIENEQFAENNSIDLGLILEESLDLLEHYIQEKDISIEVNRKDSFLIQGNITLVEILLNNLLINAIHHNTKQGKLIINLEANQLSFSNSGIDALDIGRIFKRFEVSSSQISSSGLGLAIVTEICKRYHWQIDYAFEDSLHHFSVKFQKF